MQVFFVKLKKGIMRCLKGYHINLMSVWQCPAWVIMADLIPQHNGQKMLHIQKPHRCKFWLIQWQLGHSMPNQTLFEVPQVTISYLDNFSYTQRWTCFRKICKILGLFHVLLEILTLKVEWGCLILHVHENV